jgi:oligosaccharide repeat unit polymerase
MLYGKGGDVNDSAKDNIQVTSETTALYLVSSINALDYEVKNKVKSNYPGENSLRFFIKIGQGLNLASEKKVGTLLSDYAFIPYPVNVYTVYSPYMRDFGKLYAWLMIALFGAIHSMVFYNTQRIKNLRNTLYYSFLLFPLLMSFFQDQYMSLFSFWIQIIFFIELFLFLNKLFISWKQTSVQIS